MASATPDPVFDPLAVENVGITLAVELLEQPLSPMPPPPFRGAGIYALYYMGPHPDYQQLIALGAGKYPVYIGKAVRANAKQGFNPKPSTGDELHQRICDHAESITQHARYIAANPGMTGLSLADFQCRYLVIQDAYIALAEAVMIMVFRPPWNGMGFGSKVVGVHRTGGRGSLWDSLHPGRLGRPSGTPALAQRARSKILDSIRMLQTPHTDPVAQEMFDRIMKFV